MQLLDSYFAMPRQASRLWTVLLLIAPMIGLLACQPAEKTATLDPAAQLAAQATDTIGDCPVYEPLQQPPVLSATGDGGVLSTQLFVRMVDHVEPVVLEEGDDNEPIDCEMRSMQLRTYGYPDADGQLHFVIPGPTLRLSKTYVEDPGQPFDPVENPQTRKGSRLEITLRNELPNNSFPSHECEPAFYEACKNNPAEECCLHDPANPGNCPEPPEGETWTCASDPAELCVETPVPQEAPNCYHGTEVTNLHFHGSHFSPQPFQDFVLLSLYSASQTDPPAPEPNGYDIAVGRYPIDVPQVPWNQPPGTHWYHPHKHGSTALQVGNGMAGGLLIEGPFDDWLYGYYGVDSQNSNSLDQFEKLLVVHQAKQNRVFYTKPLPAGEPPFPLVNGQLVPTVQMQYGEVQRWRLIGATMNPSAQLNIKFPDGFEVKQIAQDGVQFAVENYERQPFLVGGEWTLAPGNRIDFLVKAPDAPAGDVATPRMYHVGQRVAGRLGEIVKQRVRERAAGLRKQLGVQVRMADETFTEALFAIALKDEAEVMNLPAADDWPAMPYYLRDIDADEIDDERTFAYSMTDPETGNQTPVAAQPNGFWINEVQFDGSCANTTAELGSAEQWTLTNDTLLGHPHHIHTNPFQLLQDDTTTYEAPYPWMDTLSLPVSTDGTVKEAVARQRYEDYSGVFVLHCHYLGHEDRGMMQLVQTVCPERNDFGTPLADGLPDDCAQTSPLYPEEWNPFPSCGVQ